MKHHFKNYNDKMPLWVIVELMSFSNLSKLYSAMYFSEKDYIASNIGVSRDTLQNHLHCLAVLRNKCAHAARMYNTKFYPPVRFTKSFLQKNSEVKNDSLFAYALVLLKRLPDKESKRSLIESVIRAITKYAKEIDLKLLGFPSNYDTILKNNIL